MKEKLKNIKGINTRYNQSVRIKNATAGITLIALVVTIIVLIILTGVSVSLILGQNGLINRTKSGNEKYLEQAAREKLELAIESIRIDKKGTAKLIDLNNINEDDIQLLNTILEDDIEVEVVVNRKYKYLINSNFNVYYMDDKYEEDEDENQEIEIKFNMPTLTSDNCTIDGKTYIMLAKSVHSTNYAYKIFDKTVESGGYGAWHSTTGSSQWIQMQFPEQIKIKKFTIKNRNYSPAYAVANFELQASNDGTEWVTLGNYTNKKGTLEETSFEVQDYDYYYYYKLNCGSGYVSIGELILDEATIKVPYRVIKDLERRINALNNITIDSYDTINNIVEEINLLTDESKKLITNYNKLENAVNIYNNLNEEGLFDMPTLTSNNCTIDGKTYIMSAKSEFSTDYAYKIFDKTVESGGYGAWHSSTGSSQWIQMQFPEQIKIKKFTIKNRNFSPVYAVANFELQASNDGIEWVTLGNYTNKTGSLEETSFEVQDYDYYYYYRLNCGTGYVAIGEIILNEAIHYKKINLY